MAGVLGCDAGKGSLCIVGGLFTFQDLRMYDLQDTQSEKHSSRLKTTKQQHVSAPVRSHQKQHKTNSKHFAT